MRLWTKRNGTVVSAVLAVVLGLQMILYPIGAWFGDEGQADAAANLEEERRIAADLSNMTGVSIEEITRLRSMGYSWNEVMEQLRDQDRQAVSDGKEARDAVLTASGLSSEQLEQLRSEGYDDDEITEAKWSAERIVFQLTELTQNVGPAPLDPLADVNDTDEFAEKRKTYLDILEKFQLADAVRLILAWQTEFGDARQVLNEYLFMLQAGLDVETYVHEPDKYREQKQIKRMESTTNEWVTVEMLEREVLESVQRHNEQSMESSASTVTEGVASDLYSAPKPPIPDIPSPQTLDVMPPRPEQAIMDEIRTIDPKEAFE